MANNAQRTGSKNCPLGYFVLSPVLLSGFTESPQSLHWQAEVAHASCRVTASLHSPAHSDSFLGATAIGTHKKTLFFSFLSSYRHPSDWVGRDLGIAPLGRWAINGVLRARGRKSTVTWWQTSAEGSEEHLYPHPVFGYDFDHESSEK